MSSEWSLILTNLNAKWFHDTDHETYRKGSQTRVFCQATVKCSMESNNKSRRRAHMSREWSVIQVWYHWIIVINEVEFRTCKKINPTTELVITAKRKKERKWAGNTCEGGGKCTCNGAGLERQLLPGWPETSGYRTAWLVGCTVSTTLTLLCLICKNTTIRHRLLLSSSSIVSTTRFSLCFLTTTATTPCHSASFQFCSVLSWNANPQNKTHSTDRFLAVVPCNPCDKFKDFSSLFSFCSTIHAASPIN